MSPSPSKHEDAQSPQPASRYAITQVVEASLRAHYSGLTVQTGSPLGIHPSFLPPSLPPSLPPFFPFSSVILLYIFRWYISL